jgi:protein TonB
MDARARDGREQRVRHEPRWRGLVAALCASTGLHAGALALGSILVAGRTGPAPEVEESVDGFVVYLSLGASRASLDEAAGDDREDADPDDERSSVVAGGAIETQPELLAASERDELATIEPVPEPANQERASASEPSAARSAESTSESEELGVRTAQSTSTPEEAPAVTEVAKASRELASDSSREELPRAIDPAATELAAAKRAPIEPAPEHVEAASRVDRTEAELDRPHAPEQHSLADSDATATNTGPAVLASSGTAGAARSSALAETQGVPSVRAARAGSARAGASGASGKDDVRGMPELIYAPSPPYPANAVISEEQGSVLCLLHVDTRGSVRSVEVAESSGSAFLDRAAVEGLARWRFRPFVRDGRTVAVRLRHRVVFRLDAPSGAVAGT